MYKFLTNPKISWKAKGLLSLIVSSRNIFEDHEIKNKEQIIIECSKEKKDSIRAGINELINNNLLVKKTIRNKEGKKEIIGYKWNVNKEIIK